MNEKEQEDNMFYRKEQEEEEEDEVDQNNQIESPFNMNEQVRKKLEQFQGIELQDIKLNENDLNNIKEIQQQLLNGDQINFNNPLLNKMGTALVTKAFFPSGNHIKQALTYLDLGIKIEIVIYEFSGMLFYCSLSEIWIFIFSIFLFLTHPSKMSTIWFHITHLPRGIVGLIIMKRLPQSHDMAANMSIPINERLPLQAIMNYVLQGTKEALGMFTSSTKKLLLTYFIFTIISVVLDLLNFIIAIKQFSRNGNGNVYFDIAILFFSCAFLLLDYFYLFWIISLKYKFPKVLGPAIIKSLLGTVEQIHKKLGSALTSTQQDVNQKFEGEQKKYDYITPN